MNKNMKISALFGVTCFFLGIMATMEFATNPQPTVTIYEFFAVFGLLIFTIMIILIDRNLIKRGNI